MRFLFIFFLLIIPTLATPVEETIFPQEIARQRKEDAELAELERLLDEWNQPTAQFLKTFDLPQMSQDNLGRRVLAKWCECFDLPIPKVLDESWFKTLLTLFVGAEDYHARLEAGWEPEDDLFYLSAADLRACIVALNDETKRDSLKKIFGEREWIWGSTKVPACHKNSLLSHIVRMIPFHKAFTAITRYLDAALKEPLDVYHDSVKKQGEVGPVYTLSQAIDQRLRSVTSQIENAVGAIPEKGERDMTDQALATLFNGYVVKLNDIVPHALRFRMQTRSASAEMGMTRGRSTTHMPPRKPSPLPPKMPEGMSPLNLDKITRGSNGGAKAPQTPSSRTPRGLLRRAKSKRGL